MKRINASQISFIALGAGINIVGSTIALFLRLPIYMDAIGTILTAAILGPFYGMIPSIISGIISGMTVDIYSFYFIPANAATGIMAGILFKRITTNWLKLPLGNLLMVFPGTLTGTVIAAYLFGGVTSSGSSLIVQLLSKSGFTVTQSVFIVQLITDYLDRFLALIIVVESLKRLPHDYVYRIKGENSNESLQ